MLLGVLHPKGYGLALALGGATPIGAALVLGAVALPTFYAVAVGAAVGIVLRHLQRVRWSPGVVLAPVPGARPLVLLVVVGVLVTLIAPMVFDGLPVLSPGGEGNRLMAGVLTKSNIAQIVYVILSVCVVVFLARSKSIGPEVVGIAAITTTTLSLWAWTHQVAGVPFPEGLFDNSPAFTFQNTFPGGAPRVRGILSEPAGLAASSLITIAYTASRLRSVQGLRRLLLLLALAAAVLLGCVSTSATFFVAGVALAAIALAVAASRFVLNGGSLSRSTTLIVCTAAIAALWLLPWSANFIGAIVDEKVGSNSYDDRSGSDAFSLTLLVDTLGLGTGLGSNRASSFAASLLSTVGIIGALLLATAIWVLVRDTWPVPLVRPVTWALIAQLLVKVISGPDLADTSGILWLSLGVLAHAATAARARAALAPDAPFLKTPTTRGSASDVA